MSKTRIDFAGLSWEQARAGVRSKLFARDGRQLRLVEFTNEFVEHDWCTRGHVGYVLEGEVEISFDGRTEKFARGDGIFITGGEAERHKAQVTEGQFVRLLLVEDC
ncbi:MAG TPA: hypothetical protein VM934_06430 [Pyrinomonadaceae bacterium]|jgi:quercetin dioxygenase-like cupin family protein|nr:hypothetical protein [Pyrinomonadaceae bacterium]